MKGFTLLELLAVIVILAIIILIAFPFVTNVIENSKIEAIRSSGKGIMNSIKLRLASDVVNNVNSLFEYKFENGIDISDKKLDLSGSIPQNGLAIVQNNVISLAIHDGKFCYYNINATSENVESLSLSSCINKVKALIPIINADVSGANKPEIASGLIPVKFNGTSWIKADYNNEAGPNQWYDYDSKMWANAVTVIESKRSEYMNANAGTEILISDINMFYVWIPRYAYKISTNYHLSTVGTVDVKFLKNATNSDNNDVIYSTTPTYTGSSQDNYIVHPGFTFGTLDLEGIWAAKFEASSIEALSETTTGDNVTTKNIKVVPNVRSWRYIDISNAFLNTRKIENETSLYGLNSNEVDTHLMKNIEWGAIAYLTQSAYGNVADLSVNTSVGFFTGDGNYLNNTSQTSTGNVYGIYDLSGGSSEYLAAYLNNGSVSLSANGSSLVSADSKYKDLYVKAATDNLYNNYSLTSTKKGDAIWEVSSATGGTTVWNSDQSSMINTTSPFMKRGGCNIDGGRAGIYAIEYAAGNAVSVNSDRSFRPILIIE